MPAVHALQEGVDARALRQRPERPALQLRQPAAAAAHVVCKEWYEVDEDIPIYAISIPEKTFQNQKEITCRLRVSNVLVKRSQLYNSYTPVRTMYACVRSFYKPPYDTLSLEHLITTPPYFFPLPSNQYPTILHPSVIQSISNRTSSISRLNQLWFGAGGRRGQGQVTGRRGFRVVGGGRGGGEGGLEWGCYWFEKTTQHRITFHLIPRTMKLKRGTNHPCCWIKRIGR